MTGGVLRYPGGDRWCLKELLEVKGGVLRPPEVGWIVFETFSISRLHVWEKLRLYESNSMLKH